MQFRFFPFFVLLSFALPKAALAGFQVLSWNLASIVQDLSGAPVQDIDRHQTVTNPWQFTSLASLNNGIDFSQAVYDYSWVQDFAFGEFNSNITHAIRSEEINAISNAQIFILSDTEMRVTIDGSLSYAHTPGDESDINFNASVRNISTSEDVFLALRQGGNGHLHPSSGTLSIQGEAILLPGVTYRLQYVATSTNLADASHPPTGIIDSAGYVNFSITPEPTTLALLLPVVMLLVGRRRNWNPAPP